MPLSLATGADLATDAQFQKRVALAFYFVARNVYVEKPTTDGHENRVRFARSIVTRGVDEFMRYAAMVVTDPVIVAANPTVAAPPTDAQVVTAVTTMWNALSNVEV